MKQISRPIQNQRGQTLIEYLIIVALVGVGSIALMRAVSKQVNAQFATVVKGLGGNVQGSITDAKISTKSYQNLDMTNFGASSLDSNKKGSQSKNEDEGQ